MFCEYTVVNPVHGKQEDVRDTYMEAMNRELGMYRELLGTEQKTLVGFDIGGGTPSMASSASIARLMEAVHSSFRIPSSMEISIETTPAIAASQPDKIRDYYAMGIRRISMGVQTTDFRQSRALNRNDHGFVERAVENIRKAGFESFNVDLMYGFPIREGATGDAWAETVQDAINMGVDHITLYRMRYKGTKMAHLANRVNMAQINAQEATARRILEAAGFHAWIGKNTFSKTPGSSGCRYGCFYGVYASCVHAGSAHSTLIPPPLPSPTPPLPLSLTTALTATTWTSVWSRARRTLAWASGRSRFRSRRSSTAWAA